MFNIPFRTKSIDMHDKDDAKLWIVKNQLARRNLTPEQMKYLRGKRHSIEKQAEHSGVQNEPHPGNTAERLAKEYGVSASTIKRDAKFADKVDQLPEEEKKLVLSGEKPIDEAIREFNSAPISEIENASQKIVEAIKEEPEPKESYNLRQLKYFWGKTNKTDRKKFIKWANIKKGEKNEC